MRKLRLRLLSDLACKERTYRGREPWTEIVRCKGVVFSFLGFVILIFVVVVIIVPFPVIDVVVVVFVHVAVVRGVAGGVVGSVCGSGGGFAGHVGEVICYLPLLRSFGIRIPALALAFGVAVGRIFLALALVRLPIRVDGRSIFLPSVIPLKLALLLLSTEMTLMTTTTPSLRTDSISRTPRFPTSMMHQSIPSRSLMLELVLRQTSSSMIFASIATLALPTMPTPVPKMRRPNTPNDMSYTRSPFLSTIFHGRSAGTKLRPLFT